MTKVASMAERRHALLREVEDHVADLGVQLGMAPADAAAIGTAVADMLVELWGGQQITFPLSGFYKMSPKELDIVAGRDSGLAVWELAKQHRMTERGVRKLLARADAGRSAVSAQMELQLQGQARRD